MPNITKLLSAAGIPPYGSEELKRYESHITRFLEREYRRLSNSATTPVASQVVTDQGPMWEETKALMDEHFDDSLELFRGFLDPEFMAYTTAYYGETADQVRCSGSTLEDAERAKFRLVCERAGITGNEKIFNIGCGFGPLETYLFETYPDIEITSITPSQTQVGYIESCMADSSHPLSCGRLRLIKGSFGEVPVQELGIGKYDVVFGVGCFEHINNLDLAFQRIGQLLRPGGRCFLHLIVSRMVIPQFLNADETLIGKYFPGGKIWPYETMKSQQQYLQLERSWFINGMNYWRTLDEWQKRFWENLESLYGETLKSEEEVRHWSDYFVLCKACFAPASGALFGNGHYLFRKHF